MPGLLAGINYSILACMAQVGAAAMRLLVRADNRRIIGWSWRHRSAHTSKVPAQHKVMRFAIMYHHFDCRHIALMRGHHDVGAGRPVGVASDDY